jgi:hypothetical protein
MAGAAAEHMIEPERDETGEHRQEEDFDPAGLHVSGASKSCNRRCGGVGSGARREAGTIRSIIPYAWNARIDSAMMARCKEALLAAGARQC